MSLVLIVINLIYLGFCYYFLKRNRYALINLIFVSLIGYLFVNIIVCRRGADVLLSTKRIETLLILLALMPGVVLLCMRQTFSFLDSVKSLFSFRNLSYLSCVCIGLCFGFLRRIDVIDFSLTSTDLSRASALYVVLISLGGIFILLMFILHLKYASETQQLSLYLGMIGFVVFIFIGVAFFLRETHNCHIHHYALFLFLVFVFRFKPFWSSYLQSIFLGGYIEGVVSWNYATVFIAI